MFYSVAMIFFSGVLFALLHSVLATNCCKKIFVNKNFLIHHYRLLYVIVSLITTFLRATYVRSLPDVALFQLAEGWKWLFIGMQIIGLLVLYASVRPIDLFVFLGVRAFPEGLDPFIEKGIYCYIRHPMYFGIMIILFSMPQQSVNSLTFYFIISLYLVLGSKFEERRLRQAHPEYADYCRRVPAFIPQLLGNGKT